jgi:hypothetical protein
MSAARAAEFQLPLVLVVARLEVDAGLAVELAEAVAFVAVEALAVVDPTVVVVSTAESSAAVVATAAEVLGGLAASHPVITIMPVAPVAPVIRRARRAGCGRRRLELMSVILQPRSQSKLGAR